MTVSEYKDLYNLLIEGAVARSLRLDANKALLEPARLVRLLHTVLTEEESVKLSTAIIEAFPI